MTDDELRRYLAASPPPPEDPAARAQLEARLLAAFDERQARRPAPRLFTRHWLRWATVAAFVGGLATATAMPAEYRVMLGKRVTLRFPAGTRPPPELAHEIARRLGAEQSHQAEVGVKLRRTPEGSRLELWVWGDRLVSDAEARAQLSQLPPLQGLPVELEPLEGRVRDNVLGALRHELFDGRTSSRKLEAARQRLLEELRRREGPAADIDVQIEQDGEGRVRQRVQIRKAVPDGGAGP